MPKTYTVLSCFSGIGGLCELGIRVAGLSEQFKVTQFVESNSYCQRILQKHFPNVLIHNDIKNFETSEGNWDVIVAGFPCQDVSGAGKRAGIKPGTRSGLFFELMRVVRLVRPQYLLLENVSNLLANGMGIVLGELSESGYDCEWSCLSAAEVGAVHKRERIFVIAYASNSYRTRARLEDDRSSQQGGEPTNGSKPALVRQENGPIATKGVDSSNQLSTDANCCRCNDGSNSEQKYQDSIHQERNAQENQQPRDRWLAGFEPIHATPTHAQGNRRGTSRCQSYQARAANASERCCNATSYTDSADQRWEITQLRGAESANSNDTGLEWAGIRRAAANQVKNGTQVKPSFRRSAYGVPSRVDGSRGEDYLIRHSNLSDWLTCATDTENILYRRERLEALGNAVVPQCAAIAWTRLAQKVGIN